MTQPQPVLPLSDEVPRQLAAATAAWSKLRRAAGYASFDASVLALFGCLTLVLGGYDSVLGLFISVALLAAAFVEFRSIRRLRRLNPTALLHLTYNQLALAAALIIYAIWSLIQIANGGGMLAVVLDLASQAGSPISDPESKAAVVKMLDTVYVALIASAIIFPGLTAWYYASRRKYFQMYLEQTPAWVQQMQRERGTVSL